MAPTLIYYPVDLESPPFLLGLLMGGIMCYVFVIAMAVPAKWLLLSLLGHRSKISKLFLTAIVELFFIIGIIIWWGSAAEMEWFFPALVFVCCAMFPNLILLPNTNQDAENWSVKKYLYAFGLGCVTVLTAMILFTVLGFLFRGVLFPI